VSERSERTAVTVRRLAVLAALAPLGVAGCAPNTINDAALAPDTTTATTVFVPEGTTEDLLDQLVVGAGGLSEAIVQNEGDEALMDRLGAIWAAARPGVVQGSPDLVGEFDMAMELLERGVTRRRPADADKATRNLQTLVAAQAS
jgi:hypothetical protein